jgi:eukaryotic-like serine/threonine-protein kinase
VSHTELAQALSGQYEIEREIGRGGMAQVYLARDVRHDRPVALKVLKPDLGAAVSAERFLREIQVVGRLRHPHIVPLYDSGEAAGQVYYVMPYIKGESVRERIARSGPFSSDEAARLTTEVADALKYAHSQGIIHRDIKPDNIMLDERHALVMDFGIARGLVAGGSDSLTGTGLLIGTPAYMSPEQAAGDTVDARTDIYSLGCVLYEMLAGKPPFSGSTAHAVMAQRFASPTPSLAALETTTSPALQAAVAKAMSLMPDERYQTASEMIAAIDFARTAGSEPSAYPARSKRAFWKRVEFIGAGAAVLLVIAAGGYGLLRSQFSGDPSSTVSGGKLTTIGVLPFANQSGNRQMEYFSDGLTDELISSLSHVAGLQVAGRASSFSIKGKNLDAREAAKRLQVAYIVDAGVRSAGNKVRVTWQLIDGSTGKGLESGDIDGEDKDVIALQDSMARQIVQGLGPVIGSRSVVVTKHQTANYEAHDLYMKGHFYWNRRTAATMRQGIAFLKEAIARDPNYALAWAELSSAYTLEPAFGDMPPSETMQPARDAARKALELDPELAEANVATSMSLTFNDWDPQAALPYIEKAIALDPRNSFSRQFRVWPLEMLGRGEEALAELKRALALDPLSSIINTRIGSVLIQTNRFAEAETELRKVVAADPGNVLARFELGTTMTAQGKYKEALTTFPDAVDAECGKAYSLVGWAHAKSGDLPGARAVYDKLRKRSTERYMSAYGLAVAADAAGDRSTTLDLLEQALREHDFYLMFMPYEPGLESVRNDPRYRAVLQQVQAKHRT